MMEFNDFALGFLVLLPIVAFMYASVGHGGASGYLALMALFSLPVAFMKPTALLLNLFVAGVSFIQFQRNNHFNWKLFYPFALASIPAAFIGGYINLDPVLYKKILAVVLVFAILRLIGVFGKERSETKQPKLIYALIAGGSIGLVSGMIGIGGGIILSPLILIMGWGSMKQTAAVSALFILVNSASAMLGLISSGSTLESSSFILAGIAFAGGILGGYYGSMHFKNITLTYMLAVVLMIASVKLMSI